MFGKKRRQDVTMEVQFRKFQAQVVIVFSAIVLLVTAFLVFVILQRTEAATRENVSNLIAANSKQIEININSYLEKMEATATLLFANEDYYLYDETDESLEAYDKVKLEKEIVDRIVDLGMMENFADFFIVYPDNHTVGWTSKVTSGLFIEGDMYQTFAEYAKNETTQDGWCWGIQDNVDRIYYIKRLNRNALLVSSIYNRELERVFKHPEQLQALTVRLINDEDRILYSSESAEIGDGLPDEIKHLVKGHRNAAITDVDYITNVNMCENGWRVVCSIPTTVILEENEEIRQFAVTFAYGLAFVFVLIGILMLRRISVSVDGVVSDLAEKASYDQLSGLLNKASYREQVEKRIQNCPETKAGVFVMLDMDNFKQINDKAGHISGDQVIQRMGTLLSQEFRNDDLTGRIGGDEFAIYMEIDKLQQEEMFAVIEGKMQRLLEHFLKDFAEENEQYQTSLSIGVSVIESAEIAYEEIYRQADEALYRSKQNGKAQFNLYRRDAE